MTFGTGCPDWGTYQSHLQRIINGQKNLSYNIHNYGGFIFGRGKYVFELIKSMHYKHGDIITISFANLNLLSGYEIEYLPEGVYYINTRDLFERPHQRGDIVFFDGSHPNENGQYAVAKTIFDFLSEHNFFKDFSSKHRQYIDIHTNKYRRGLGAKECAELTKYKANLASIKTPIGAIVMNCNPFSLGHQYLVEYASAKVNHLYIFVVEEDKSFFPFTDRLDLVKQGTSHLKNVTVIPSGKFIISSLTFNDYFGKDAMAQDKVVDPSQDVELFGKEIAPTLGITVRFAGEEPLDNITRQYNETMHRILPQYGVNFEVIPRKEQGGRLYRQAGYACCLRRATLAQSPSSCRKRP
jgi:[citrate (pro-3S)-lyase] ligase